MSLKRAYILKYNTAISKESLKNLTEIFFAHKGEEEFLMAMILLKMLIESMHIGA